MANWKVGLIAGGLAVAVSAVTLAVMGTSAGPICVLALVCVPVAMFINDRLRTRPRRAPKAERAEPTPEELERVLGAVNVTEAWNLRLRRAGALVSAPSKFGGVPDFLSEEQWPRCRMCGEAMTFLGQLPVGANKSLRYPVEGRLFLFLCNSDSREGDQCTTWDHAAGCSACFVQPNALPALPFDDGEPERARLAEAVRRNERVTALSDFGGLERRGRRTYFPYLARQYVGDREERRLSTRLPPGATGDQVQCHSLAQQGFEVQISGFADWVQGPMTVTCTCGAPTEVVLQFDAFDEVINLGDAGRAYVFACKERHATDAFFLEWQCA